MRKRNIARSGESADAFERTSESPDRGALNGGPVPDQLLHPLDRPPGRREVRVSRGASSGRPPKGGARRLRDVGSPSERDPDAGEDEPRLHPVRGPRGRSRADDDEPPAVPRRRRRRDALHGRHGTRGPRAPHARVPGRRVVASVRTTSGGGGLAMMQSPPKAMTPRAKTGIPVLDERLQGGFPRPSTLLLFSDKPTEQRWSAQH